MILGAQSPVNKRKNVALPEILDAEDTALFFNLARHN
jgi:hypothetical protein